MRSVAVYSACGAYRYALTRVWEPSAPRVLFVMLNPSTATERHNDPTVERCERRARAQGFGAVRVVNLFAWRATDPRDLKAAADPIGPRNDAVLIRSVRRWIRGGDDRAICAWGVLGAHLERGAAVETALRATGRALHHLGLTRGGHPGHPLYIAYARAPESWR